MKVVGISGSPRVKGNTEYLVGFVLSKLSTKGAETELITLSDKSIAPCKACYHCVKEKDCSTKDDFQDIFAKMCGADALVIGSPVHHAGITAKLKGFLDRTGFVSRWIGSEMKKAGESYRWKGTALSRKILAPITVARRTGHTFALAQLLLWGSVNDLIIVSADYWPMAVAGAAAAVDAESDEEGLTIMERLAENIYFLLEKLPK